MMMRTRILFVLVMTIGAAVLFGLAAAPRADAKAVQIDPSPYSDEVWTIPPAPTNGAVKLPWKGAVITHVEWVEGRWSYAEFSDGSNWMVTRCRYEDSRNCRWNAAVRGVPGGRSFITLGDRTYYMAHGHR